MRVLLIAPYFDKNVAGESYVSYRWVKGISDRFPTTVLTTHVKGWDASLSPTGTAEIVNWEHRPLTGRLARLDHELKPHYLPFYFKARRWMKERLAAGESFDLVHQLNPIAMRYPCPAQGLGMRYILGPFGGGVRTPPGFESENADRQWYRKLRNLDHYRLRFDPWMRKSYEEASLFIGVAPYVEEWLRPLRIQRFVPISEAGVDLLPPAVKAPAAQDAPVQLLFVGRLIRTKGLIDAIRAVALASKQCHVQFTVIGAGDAREACEQEVARLGIAHLVRFLGRIPKEEVLPWYGRSDVFLFPSFREPTGQVLFEAMVAGLPIITSSVGGPGFIVTDQSGIRVNPLNPEQYANELSAAVVTLARNPELRQSMGEASRARMREIALWENKFDHLFDLYEEVTGGVRSADKSLH